MKENSLSIPSMESGAFISVLEKELGPDFVVTDMTSVWGRSWIRHIAQMDATFGRIIGNQAVRGFYDPNLPSFAGTGWFAFSFQGERFLVLQYPSGYDTIHLMFSLPTGAERIPELTRQLLDMEHEMKELSIWNGRDIPLNRLDTENFVVPASVERSFESEICPQLKEVEIFNHVLLFSYPGVGKTAFCRHLAKQFPQWKTIVVFPSSIDKPREIMSVFDYASYRSPAILVFEDIDTWAQSRYEDTSFKESFTPYLGALLNGVDGVESHQGLLVIATTNNPQCLDPAIMRPGRFGIQVNFKYTEEELAHICSNYLGEERGKDFFRPYLRNTPAHIRALMKTARAYHKLHGAEITHELLDDIDSLLKGSPKLPKPEDMFVKDKNEEVPKEAECVGYA